MSDRIPIPGWRHVCRMRSIEANAANLMTVNVEDRDLVLLLKNLDLEFQRQNEGWGLGAALVSRIGEIDPRKLSIAPLLYDFSCLRGQYGIGVIAYAFIGVGQTRCVRHGTRARQRRLEMK